MEELVYVCLKRYKRHNASDELVRKTTGQDPGTLVDFIKMLSVYGTARKELIMFAARRYNLLKAVNLDMLKMAEETAADMLEGKSQSVINMASRLIYSFSCFLSDEPYLEKLQAKYGKF